MKDKDIKDKSIHIRVSEYQRHTLDKLAKKNNMTLTKYMLECALNNRKNKPDNLTVVKAATIVQEICNYLEENYINDDYIEELNKKLWKIL